MSACSAKFRSLSTDDEVRNTIKVLECEIAEVDVGRRMRELVAKDAANGHPILQLCRRNIFVHLDVRGPALSGWASRRQLDRLKSARALHQRRGGATPSRLLA